MKRLIALLYITYFDFAVNYRRTMIGPLWVLLSPALFIASLGLLFAQVGGASASSFIPHLAIGFVIWTLVSGFVSSSTTVFQRGSPQIMQGGMSLIDLAIVDVMSTLVQFLHQAILIVAIFLIFDLEVSARSALCIPGILLIVANGFWLTLCFGIIGARYRDLTEIVNAIMRIAFLATPIIWMPDPTGHGGLMGAYLTWNPFYHFLELVRAPLLQRPFPETSWYLATAITCAGFVFTLVLYRRLSHRVALWV